MLKQKFLLFTIHYLLLTLLSGCTTIYNPATGRRESFFINTATEIAIGKSVAHQVQQQYRILDDEKRQKAVQEIGQKVAQASERQDLQYSFTVLDSKELNAFSLPGGGVYICKALADKLDEDELACVLAHEVGHIAARHAVKRIQGQIGYQLLLSVASYELNKKDEKLAKTAAQGANVIFQLVLLDYSREDEILADRLAIKYAHKAGYRPWGMVTSLKKLKEYSKEKDSWRGLVIFRSHPYLADRIRAAEAEAGAIGD